MRTFLLVFVVICAVAAVYAAAIETPEKDENVDVLSLEAVDSSASTVDDENGKRVTRQFGFGFPGYGFGYRPFGGFGGYGGYGFRPYGFGGFGYRPFGYGFYG